MSSIKFFLPSSDELISRESVLLQWEKVWDFWSWEEIKKTMRLGDNILLFVEKDGELAGMAFWSYSGDAADLLYVFVPDEFRGQKFGHQLLDSSFKYLVDRGVQKGFLEVRPSNSSALFLYQRLGFMEINRRKSYYADGEDCLVMGKEFI